MPSVNKASRYIKWQCEDKQRKDFIALTEKYGKSVTNSLLLA